VLALTLASSAALRERSIDARAITALATRQFAVACHN
jgi:hypothetical protein